MPAKSVSKTVLEIPFDAASHGWIQWKGTDACIDFYCKCGTHGHLDGDFLYFVQCKECSQVYALNGNIRLEPCETPDADGHSIHVFSDDD